MVQIMTRPSALPFTSQDEADIFDLLRASSGMSADELAGTLCMDEVEAAIYLANQAGLDNLDYRDGEYSVFFWP